MTQHATLTKTESRHAKNDDEPQIKATLIHHCGDDDTVVNAARVSFAKEASQFNEDQNHKLIRYLAREGHESPFNHCFATFHVKAPIFVARQLMRHEYLCINEISRRYVDTKPEFYMPTWRSRAANKKQGSGDLLDAYDSVDATHITEGVFIEVSEAYTALLKLGVAPEQARCILPVTTLTEWYWSGTMGAWWNMCRQREGDHTQIETSLIATEISFFMSVTFPKSWKALSDASSYV